MPQVSIQQLTGDIPITLIDEVYENGNTSTYEQECICRLVAFHKPEKLFEIGTFNGRTALHMAAHSTDQAHVYTLDLPREQISETKLRIKSGEREFIDKDTSGNRFVNTPYESKITQLYGDSANFDCSMLENKMDFIFIDGSHCYDYVINDTQVALRLLRKQKGVILWHDYSWNDVINSLNQMYLNDPMFKNLKLIEGTTLAYLHLE